MGPHSIQHFTLVFLLLISCARSRELLTPDTDPDGGTDSTTDRAVPDTRSPDLHVSDGQAETDQRNEVEAADDCTSTSPTFPICCGFRCCEESAECALGEQEVRQRLPELFAILAAYYAGPCDPWITTCPSPSATACFPQSAVTANQPGDLRDLRGTWELMAGNFFQLGFTPDFLRCRYEIDAVRGGRCGGEPNRQVAELRARCDEDNDGVSLEFRAPIVSNAANELVLGTIYTRGTD
ncbi:MAG: hypothetical protein AAF645_08610 [Myxococcota bacterium]